MPSLSSLSANRFLQLLVLLLIVAGVYSDSLSGSFHFDDLLSVVHNPAVTQLQYFADLDGTRYLTQLSFVLDRAWSGAGPWGYHLTNLILHGICVVLVYLLIQLLLGKPAKAYQAYLPFVAALLFAVHPIQTMAVDYISQRAAVLAALFYLASVVLFIYARSAQGGGARWALWASALLAGFLAMKCKENSFTLPFAILLTEYLFVPQSGWRQRWLAFTFLLLLPVIPLSHIDIMRDAGTGLTRQAADISRWSYLLTESRVVVTYLRLLFVPMHQTMDYDYAVSHSLDFGVLAAIALHVILLGTSAVLFLKRRRLHPLLGLAAFGGLWFYLTLAVESSLIPIHDVINEYRLYLPSVGFILAAVCLGSWLISRLRQPLWRRGLALALPVCLAGTHGALTYARNQVWHDELSLWSDVVQKAPHKARGHNNLAIAYMNSGDLTDAVQEFTVAVQDDPGNVEYLMNLAGAYSAAGQHQSALSTLQRAVALAPQDAAAHSNLGNLYARGGHADAAFQQYQLAVQLEPDKAMYHDNLGTAYQRRGAYADAIREYSASTRLDPGDSMAWGNLGAAEQASGQIGTALEDYRRALGLDPNNSQARFNFGLASMQVKQYADACSAFEGVLQRQPTDAWAAYYLADCKLETGDRAGALQLLKQVVAHAPGVTPAEQLLQRLR